MTFSNPIIPDLTPDSTRLLNRLRWQCRRGLLELDLLLDRFLEKCYLNLSPAQQDIFNELLTHSDQQLLYWLTDQAQIPPPLIEIMNLIRQTAYIPVYIGLGSNLNKPIIQLKTALTALSELNQTTLMQISSFYQTKPIGNQAQPDFLNAVAYLHTQLTPATLLEQLQQIEQNQGRTRNNQIYQAPRTLDLDILLYDKQSIHTNTLTIPHPRLQERAFVLVPLLEITPDLQLPDQKLLQDCLIALGDISQQIQRIDLSD